ADRGAALPGRAGRSLTSGSTVLPSGRSAGPVPGTFDRTMTDVQANYRLVSSGFGAAVKAVAPEQWDLQSPCENWKARDIVPHVVEGHRGVIAGVRGGESSPLGA